MRRLCTLVFVVTLSVTSLAWAQPGGGRGGFGGPGGFGGGSLLDLARIEAVQKEIEAVDDQLKGIEKLSEEMRAARGDRQRPDFGNMSEAEREKAMAEMGARREKEAATANAKLAEILLPPQIERLEQISLQIRGTSALSDPKVAAKLSLTEDQKKKLEAAATANREAMRQAFQGGNRDQNQDREKMRAKFQELRKAADEKVLAVLTADQKAAFEKLKGAAFTMPEGAGRGPQGGRRGGGQGGQGGQGGGRGGNQ
jgi:Spy/CpxP family protein refolding chaperone